MNHFVKLGCVVFLLGACIESPPPPASPSTGPEWVFEDLGNHFFHDQDGRLVAVRDASGASTRYVYAEDGSHSETQRLAATDLALFEFFPHAGPVGTQVVLEGSGFGSTPADNTVRFNGHAARVLEASAWRLVVTVPEGATSGLLSLEVQGRGVHGAVDFKVADASELPVIRDFFPTMGGVNSRFTLQGSGFAPEIAGNQVFVGGQLARVETASPTQLEVRVGQGAPGRLRVSTARGEASSAQSVVMLSSGGPLYKRDVLLLEVNGPPVEVDLVGRIPVAALSFTLLEDESVGLGVANWKAGIADLEVFDSTGALVSTALLDADQAQRVFLLPRAPRTGRYTVMVYPRHVKTDSWRGSFALRRDVSTVLEPD